MATISNNGAIDTGTQNNSSTTTKKSNDELGKNEFLNLLVTQMRYQNPMEPMEDKEFIAQMAQFSSLEQMQNMNASMQTTLQQLQYMNGTLLTSQASSMIGKEITWTDENKLEQSGVVSAVKFVDGALQLKIGDKTAYLTQVTEIKEAAKGA